MNHLSLTDVQLVLVQVALSHYGQELGLKFINSGNKAYLNRKKDCEELFQKIAHQDEQPQEWAEGANYHLGIDFPTLREQKSALLEAMNHVDPKTADHLQGIVNILDQIQDTAVDKYGRDAEEVFGKLG